ncbi:MAG: hypothetical protein VXY83_03425, partial [Pseudomonadota bacterium]|nr:hypothetical protein [Pseudomonadota bacterium]
LGELLVRIYHEPEGRRQYVLRDGPRLRKKEASAKPQKASASKTATAKASAKKPAAKKATAKKPATKKSAAQKSTAKKS